MFCLADRFHQTLPGWRRIARVAAASVTLGLTACGGGDRVEPYEPGKIVSFGDESSVLTSKDADGTELGIKGLKYTVNRLSVVPGVAWPLVLPPVLKITASPPVPADAQSLRYMYLNDLANPADDVPAGVFPTTRTSDPAIFHEGSSVERAFTVDVLFKPAGSSSSTPDESRVGASVAYQYVYQCAENRLWIQILANSFGLGYGSGDSACPLDDQGAVSHAQAGAKVADVAAQVAAHRSELDSETLATVFVGQNDVIEEFEAIKNTPAQHEAAKARMKARGEQLAQLINDMIKTGARVLMVTLPDVGGTPYGRGSVNPVLLSGLTKEFNEGLTGANGGVINDGRKILVVDFKEYFDKLKDDLDFDTMFVNIDSPACTSGRDLEGAVVSKTGTGYGLYCNNYTLGSDVDPFSYFWADDVNLSPGAHARLGNLAFDRISDNLR